MSFFCVFEVGAFLYHVLCYVWDCFCFIVFFVISTAPSLIISLWVLVAVDFCGCVSFYWLCRFLMFCICLVWCFCEYSVCVRFCALLACFVCFYFYGVHRVLHSVSSLFASVR